MKLIMDRVDGKEKIAMKIILLLMVLSLSGCSGYGWMLCGDRGIQQWWTMGHGVKCEGDMMCANKWVQSICCCEGNKICQNCQ